jgi:hypothetical protein
MGGLSDHDGEDGHGDEGEDHGEAHHKTGGHDGGHHVPPPSWQLDPHTYTYKPEGFELSIEEIGLRTYLVSMEYPVVDEYDRYIIRVRFHGHEEFATSKMKVNRTDANELVLKNFLEASYVVCVSLFSSSGLPEYPPLSTSDMCVDLTVGDSHPIGGGHHGSTGLLSPLLLAVAFVLLIIITIGTKIKKAYVKRFRKSGGEGGEKISDQGSGVDGSSSHVAVLPPVVLPMSGIRGRAESIVSALRERRVSKIEKSETEQRLDFILNRDSEPKWRAAANMCKIVNSNSAHDELALRASQRRLQMAARRPVAVVYENGAYEPYCDDDVEVEYDIEEEDDEAYFDEEMLSDSEVYDDEDVNGQVTSVQSVSHVLDNKPWIVRQQQSPARQLYIQNIEKF